jgi:hypothetical protein
MHHLVNKLNDMHHLVYLLQETFKIIWLSNHLTERIPDEGYSRNVSCDLLVRKKQRDRVSVWKILVNKML